MNGVGMNQWAAPANTIARAIPVRAAVRGDHRRRAASQAAERSVAIVSTKRKIIGDPS
jgi:hypothetical protein